MIMIFIIFMSGIYCPRNLLFKIILFVLSLLPSTVLIEEERSVILHWNIIWLNHIHLVILILKYVGPNFGMLATSPAIATTNWQDLNPRPGIIYWDRTSRYLFYANGLRHVYIYLSYFINTRNFVSITMVTSTFEFIGFYLIKILKIS